jgi:5-methylcytosine-specific restriction endonuclease McrA
VRSRRRLTHVDQHAAFPALWLQYDHVIPHAVGGTNHLDNVVVTCAGCSYARLDCTLEEMGLEDPRARPRTASDWDGLERFR